MQDNTSELKEQLVKLGERVARKGQELRQSKAKLDKLTKNHAQLEAEYKSLVQGVELYTSGCLANLATSNLLTAAEKSDEIDRAGNAKLTVDSLIFDALKSKPMQTTQQIYDYVRDRKNVAKTTVQSALSNLTKDKLLYQRDSDSKQGYYSIR